MANYNTESNITIITTNMIHIFIVSLFLSLIFASAYFLILFFSRVDIDLKSIVTGGAIFVASLISNLLVRTEYFLAIKNGYKMKFPLQFSIIFSKYW